MLNQIPRPLLVFGALVLSIGLLFVLQAPHSVCTNQLEVFKEAQGGLLFPRTGKKSKRPPTFTQNIEACKMGNSPGACFDLFSLLRKLVRDLNGSPQECLAPFGEVEEVKRALHLGLQLMVQIAWGDKPPQADLSRFGWLEAPDLGLFCQLKSTYHKVYGEEEWEKFRISTQAKLPGEAQKIEEGNCLNCDSMKKASDVLSPI